MERQGYVSVSRTLCPEHSDEKDTQEKDLFLGVSTSQNQNIQFNAGVTVIQNFLTKWVALNFHCSFNGFKHIPFWVCSQYWFYYFGTQFFFYQNGWEPDNNLVSIRTKVFQVSFPWRCEQCASHSDLTWWCVHVGFHSKSISKYSYTSLIKCHYYLISSLFQYFSVPFSIWIMI